jgi:DNA modification methylase
MKELPVKYPCYYSTEWGATFKADSLEFMASLPDKCVNLVMTSPPFALQRKKEYGNVEAKDYIEWLTPFAKQIHRILVDDGSFVIDIGGSWEKGRPTRSLYHLEIVIAFVKDVGFHLAQEFFWYNPAKLPTPAEWVNVRRVRVKDAVNTIWWLSKIPFPKANNRNVLVEYSDSMKGLLVNGYKAKLRPSGHDISTKFSRDNGGAIPSNMLQIANTESNSAYLRECRAHQIKPHPARFPQALPEFFIRLLTDPGDIVLDPFGGSMVTGAACEVLKRRWYGVEIVESYLEGSRFRFTEALEQSKPEPAKKRNGKSAKQIPLILFPKQEQQVTSPGVIHNAAYSQDHISTAGQVRERPKRGKSSK